MKIIIMKWSILLFSILFCLTADAQLYMDKKFTERRADSISIPIDSILVVGMGSTVTRIFLDDLATALAKKLLAKNVSAYYVYLGKTRDIADKALAMMDKSGYKAILYFTPANDAFTETHNGTSMPTIPTNYGPVTLLLSNPKSIYQQEFEVEFSLNTTTITNFWKANFKIDCNGRTKSCANNVAKKMMDRFSKNRYVK